MRVSLFLGNHHRITRSADRVITIVHEGPITGDELNIYVGTYPAETAVIADRLIEALQAIRGRALRQAIELGQTDGIGAATHIRNDIAEIEARLPGGFDAPELHGGEVTSIGILHSVDDRPEACTEEGHVPGCPGRAGGDHELLTAKARVTMVKPYGEIVPRPAADGDHFAGRD